MTLILIGFSFMLFGYGLGIFEWDYFIIFSNLLGVCIAYPGYLKTSYLRKLHLTYPIIFYGLANLLFLALRFNNLSFENFPINNGIIVFLNTLSIIFAFIVLFYPSIAVGQIIKTTEKEYTSIESKFEKNTIQYLVYPIMLIIGLAYFTYRPAIPLMMIVYVGIHLVILTVFGVKYFSHTREVISSDAINPVESINQETEKVRE